MMIGATLPATNLHFFQSRRSSFRCNGSRLNPSPASISTKSLVNTRKHISNLEKLLQNQSGRSELLDDPQVVEKTTRDLAGSVEPFFKSNGRNNRKCWLEGLNLSRIWHARQVTDEMSPRHLNKLKKLLSSNNVEYSPRNNLGCNKWREYHGSNDWLGLIEPLDENLRRELVRYGEFIQEAYHSFHSNPVTNEEEEGTRKVVLNNDESYKVTKNLYATSSIGLPKWVDDVAPDLGWMTQRSSWIGYVAVCDDLSEIQRMGRRDIVIALRGTATCLEWGENFRDLLVQIPSETTDVEPEPEPESGSESEPDEGQAKVECGFLSLFRTSGVNVPSLAESVVNEVQRLIEQYKGESLSITVTGHSLGAALALLVADEVSTCAPDVPPVAVFSFGGPRVGNRSFADRLNSKNVKVLRIVNNQDVITRVPGMFVSEELDKRLRESEFVNKMLNVLDKSMPWAYTHVGTELRVDTRMSPVLKPDADVACCHDLEAYLHLVDGYLASNCPFRANAKRSLAKLLNEQRSNIKKLYTCKPKELNIINLEREHSFSTPSCLPSPSS
ncbi:Phospholipase A1-Ibeta2, chloroplastic [Capsicum annuum]|uniref:Phospholipase A1-Ibeta2, chloroplastic n=1 Tax=Capsicum annuum TaxID=4072 RepID=A0A1U8EXL8_CAPAN|nr:phospholipase A1-Ibeta2, chloroplastic [Capsicum annuum]KAF3616855.1 Phospholipase A1-Ibeta2, chloroplastic [Capsicum annuum]KAF3674228.1 Phospholipase A1-Ibeta2, chloroplastic [Capsicum annuum]PHT96169.1 Phospholipase A1-Ibeta2, chloroplastic [Capsicum annuum]